MGEFSIGSTVYRSRPFPPSRGVHVFRKAAPAYFSLVSIFGTVRAVAERERAARVAAGVSAGQGLEPGVLSGHEWADVLVPFMEKLASMPDADVDYVINACLESTDRRVEGGPTFQKVREKGVVNNQEDDEIDRRLMITANVLAENLQSFVEKFNSSLDLKSLVQQAGASYADKSRS